MNRGKWHFWFWEKRLFGYQVVRQLSIDSSWFTSSVLLLEKRPKNKVFSISHGLEKTDDYFGNRQVT